MITIRIFGGLGNQLFQYAFGRLLAFRKKTDLHLDYYDQITRKDCDGVNLTKITDVFNLPVRLSVGKMRKNLVERFGLSAADQLFTKIYLKTRCVISENTNGYCHKEINTNKNIYLIGYWQSEDYFADIKELIKKEYKFKIEKHASNLEIYKNIVSQNSVGIHIRGKDYLVNPIYGRCDVSYYLNAIELIQKTNPDLQVFIFTDDLDYVNQNFQPLLKFSEIVNVQTKFTQDTLELLLMSKCRHNIICNSSFSWWGAWLNNNPDKIIIAPKKWYTDPYYSSEKLIPAGWHKI